jgi:hypothetical protein
MMGKSDELQYYTLISILIYIRRLYGLWNLSSIEHLCYSVEEVYQNQKKLEGESKQLQAHAGKVTTIKLLVESWVVRMVLCY